MKITGKFPLEMAWDRYAKGLVKKELLEARRNNREPNLVVNPKRKGLKKYFVLNKETKDKMAYFYNSVPDLEGAVDIHYLSEKKNGVWSGCKGVNIADRTIGFEGFSRPTVLGVVNGEIVKRYVEFEIHEDNKR